MRWSAPSSPAEAPALVSLAGFRSQAAITDSLFRVESLPQLLAAPPHQRASRERVLSDLILPHQVEGGGFGILCPFHHEQTFPLPNFVIWQTGYEHDSRPAHLWSLK